MGLICTGISHIYIVENCYEFTQKGLMYMSKTLTQYTVVREYKNAFDIQELVKRIVRIHIQQDMTTDVGKGCSNHEVVHDDK